MQRFTLIVLSVLIAGCQTSRHWQDNLAASFQDMARYFPVREIKAGGTASRLPPVKGEVLPDYAYKGVQYTIDDFISRTLVSGLLILRDGRVVHESYHQGADPSTLFTSWSVAKSVTATLVGFARDDGLIESLDDKLTRYLPELTGSGYEGVTIREALQMSSGVNFDETYEDPDSDFWVFMDQWAGGQGRANEYLQGTRRIHEPGSTFYYNTTETQVLGWLVARVTGSSVSAYLAAKIWQPAGMEADGNWMLDAPGGMEITGIGLNARLRDYGRFGHLYATGTGLPARWVQESTWPSDPQVSHGALYESMTLGYQYQWWSFPDGSFEAQGIHGQFIYVNPANRLVVVVMSAWPEPWVLDHEFEFYSLVDALNKSWLPVDDQSLDLPGKGKVR